MSTENISLRQQVSESIKTDSIVRVDATGCNIADIMAQLSVMDGVDADYSRENDGTWDVFGTADGDEFRLRVTCNNPPPHSRGRKRQGRQAPAHRPP